MFQFSHTVPAKSSKEIVWAIYADPATWPTWDDEIEWAKLDGPFAKDTTGQLKPAGGPAVKFVITECSPHTCFADRSFLPLTHLDFVHEISGKAGNLSLTHTVTITGWLSWIFGFVIGRKIVKKLPEAMQNLAALAEERYGK